ncbi:MAG: hypothetical protein ACI4OJ_11610 [Lachnospiraceae bacterium]
MDGAANWKTYLEMEEQYQLLVVDCGLEDILAARQVFSTFLHTLRSVQEESTAEWTSLPALEQETGITFLPFLNRFLETLRQAALYRSLSDACDSLCSAFPAGCGELRIATFKIEALIHLGEAAKAVKWCDSRISATQSSSPYVEIQDVLSALLAAGRCDIAVQLCDEEVGLVEREQMDDRLRNLLTAMRSVYDAAGDRRKSARLSWLLTENQRRIITQKTGNTPRSFFHNKAVDSSAFFEDMLQDEEFALRRNSEDHPGEPSGSSASIFLFPGRHSDDKKKE